MYIYIKSELLVQIGLIMIQILQYNNIFTDIKILCVYLTKQVRTFTNVTKIYNRIINVKFAHVRFSFGPYTKKLMLFLIIKNRKEKFFSKCRYLKKYFSKLSIFVNPIFPCQMHPWVCCISSDTRKRSCLQTIFPNYS